MDCYVIADDLSYRREHFGGIALNRRLQSTRFFNHSAAKLIESCARATPLSELIDTLGGDGRLPCPQLQDFVEEQIGNGFLVRAHKGKTSRATLFNVGVESFLANCLHAPLGVEIELTLKCLRSCRYCAYDAHPKASQANEFSLSDWKKCLEKLSRAGVFFVRFTGGDPLTRPDFASILRCADDLGFIITVGSDLTRLTDEHVAALADARNLYALQTTIDGASPATADLLRGPGNFAAVTQGIRRLKAAGIPVIAGTVLNRRNVREVADIAALVGGLGADGYCVAPLYAAGRGTSSTLTHLLPTNDDLAIAAEAMKRAVDEGVVAPADPAWIGATAEIASSELRAIWSDQGYLARRPDTLVRIDPRGRLYVSIKLKPSLEDQIYFGNIGEVDIGQLWREAPLLNRLRGQASQRGYFGEVIDVREVT